MVCESLSSILLRSSEVLEDFTDGHVLIIKDSRISSDLIWNIPNHPHFVDQSTENKLSLLNKLLARRNPIVEICEDNTMIGSLDSLAIQKLSLISTYLKVYRKGLLATRRSCETFLVEFGEAQLRLKENEDSPDVAWQDEDGVFIISSLS